MPIVYELHVSISEPATPDRVVQSEPSRAVRFSKAVNELIYDDAIRLLPTEVQEWSLSFSNYLQLNPFSLRASLTAGGDYFFIDVDDGPVTQRIEVDNGHWRYRGQLRKRPELAVMMGRGPGYCEGFQDGVCAALHMVQEQHLQLRR